MGIYVRRGMEADFDPENETGQNAVRHLAQRLFTFGQANTVIFSFRSAEDSRRNHWSLRHRYDVQTSVRNHSAERQST